LAEINHINLVATTLEGLESALEAELKALGAFHTQARLRAVEFVAAQQDLDNIVSYNRLALRIMHPISEFSIRSGDQLYAKAKAIDWSKWLDPEKTFAIDTTVRTDLYRHTKYPAMLLKDAICDQQREQFNKRSSIDVEEPHLRIQLQVFDQRVRVLADLVGRPLFKRGYRRYSGGAPLNEVLAAGLIQLSGWEVGKESFYDPMTGSGTLLAEAALLAQKIPHRKPGGRWPFQRWSGFMSQRDRPEGQPEKPQFIEGADLEYDRVNEARKNLDFAGLYYTPRVQQADFFKDPAPDCEPGVMIINPPYDERLSLESDLAFYAAIGDTLKRNYKGWKVWIFSGNKEAMKNIGLRTAKRLNLKNGPIECRFYRYDMF